jgi:hypothetical protein
MKLKLLIAFMMLSLVSCSDDDSNTTGEKQLDKIVHKSYNNNGVLVDNSYITYDNNRMTGVYFVNPNGEIIGKTEFFYNENGSLSKIIDDKAFYDDINGVVELGYDSQGRLITMLETYNQFGEEYIHTGNYVYNQDNTITYTGYIPNGDSDTKIFSKNASGQIDKILYNGTVTQAVYDGEDIVSYSDGTQTVSFTFDSVNTPVGPLLQSNINHMGGNFQNMVLWMGFEGLAMGVSKYMIGRSSTVAGNSSTFEYEFDEEGYPVKRKLFRQGENLPYSVNEIIYE